MGYWDAPDEPGRPSGSARRVHPRVSGLAREERGQSLVVIVISMTLIVLIAALAIDASSWFAKHHQAQVTADAAALAAANYMGTAIAAGTTPATAQPTGIATAVTYASKNGLPINSGDVTVDITPSDPGYETVTVTVPTTGPLFFAGISLGSGPSISAKAVASWAIRDCTSGGANCAFAYAGDNSCSGTTGVNDAGNNGPFNHGITISKTGTGNGYAIIGDVISASEVTASNNGSPTYNSTAEYPSTDGATPANSCVNSHSPTTAAPKPFTTVLVQAVASQFPIDYRQIYPACPGTSILFGTVTCNTVTKFPSYCTPAAENLPTVGTVNPNAIYCDAGTGNPSDPRTYNGTITVTAGGAGSTVDATYLAGIVNFNIPSNTILGPASGNTLLAYGAECNNSTPLPNTCPTGQTTTTQPAVYFTSTGNATISGDIFAPAGVIDSQLGGTPTITGFLEGWDVAYQANGTVTGQGPLVNNNGNFVGDFLIQ